MHFVHMALRRASREVSRPLRAVDHRCIVAAMPQRLLSRRATSQSATSMPVTNPHFPIGKYHEPATVTPAQRAAWMDDVAGTPAAMRAAVSGLSPAQLDTPYRDSGWTLRQVVHHVPDSHMNAYMRFKLALTEDVPVIKPYDQARWAELPDSAATPIETSLALLDALHARWVRLMRAMSPADFARSFRHPEYDRIFTLDSTLGLYAWHGRHHVAHITALRERNGW